MNYEKMYKDALSRAAFYNGELPTENQRKMLLDIFPELKEKESEDEKIRKDIISYLRNEKIVKRYISDIEIDKWIAWLEKQGKRDARYKCLEELLEADTEYQIAMNDAMVEEAKTKAIEAISDMPIFELLGLEKQGEPKDKGEISDGYHTFNELYQYRMLYNAAFFNMLPKEIVHKSKRHHDGEECFGGGWFVVMANLPTGQISNHYELKNWDLFQIPEKEIADEWDGHTPQEAAERLHRYLLEKQGEQPSDKIELKFKEGDFIVPNNITSLEIWKVINIDDDGYYNIQPITNIINTEDDEIYRVPDFIIEKDYRLWTINDARDGDVLVDSYSKDSIIILYKGIDKERSILAHCGWNGYNLSIKTNGLGYGGLDNTNYLPATKEQRDLLFEKMKQEGYEWNAENKKLSKQSLKITPKFCVGQLITDNNGTWYKITNIKCLDDWYYVVYDVCEDTTHHELCSIIDEKFRENRFVGEIKKMIGD